MEEYITDREAEEIVNKITPLAITKALTFKDYAKIMIICASALKRLEREV